MFDYLHDMGYPIGAARRIREVIAAEGTWMIFEPAAGDHVEDNRNPIGRYYGFSTLLCTPSSLAQPVGLALGTQAGPARIRDVGERGRIQPVPAGRADPVSQRFRGSTLSRPRRKGLHDDFHTALPGLSVTRLVSHRR
jgi:hypothetical protein